MGKKLNKNVPESRFPEFKETLSLKYLGEILDFKNGINADKSQYGSGKKFINVLDIINDAPIYHDSIIGSVEITEQEFQNNNVIYGDILFQRSSEIREESGQSNIYLDNNKEATFGGFVIRGRPKVSFNPIYFNYLLKTRSIRKEITDRSGGSTRFNVGQGSLSQVPILICNSIAEQEKIAGFLGAVDARLTQLRRKRDRLQTYKRGVMQKIFSQEMRFRDAIGSPFPDWQEKTLGEIAKVKRGASPRPISSPKWFSTQSKIGWVRISDVTKSNKYLEETEQYLSEFGIEKSRFVLSGNLIMSICATIGKPIITNIDVCIHDGFVIFENLQASILFVYFLLEHIEIGWKRYGQPGIQLNLNTDIVSNEPVFLPCLEEQEKIVNFLTAIDRKIEAISRQLDRTEQFKKGLLQKMFV